MKRLWVVDGDDTLWYVEPLYDDARTAAGKIVANAGLNPSDWELLERKLDVANVARFGVDPERFPTSCVEAYQGLAELSGKEILTKISDKIRIVATSVFTQPAPVHPSAASLLTFLRAHGTVVLLTRGDDGVQHRRVSQAHLEGAFDKIYVVPSKDETTFQTVIEQTGSRPSCAWSIGNSLVSDINPALRIGMNAIWVDSPVWEYERRELRPVEGNLLVVHTLRDVVSAVAHTVAIAS